MTETKGLMCFSEDPADDGRSCTKTGQQRQKQNDSVGGKSDTIIDECQRSRVDGNRTNMSIKGLFVLWSQLFPSCCSV